MRTRAGVLGLVGAAMGLACSGPSLDLPERRITAVSVDFEPEAGEGGVTSLFRARVPGAPASGSPWLFRGELSDYYARSVQHGEVPNALRERAVPLRFWRVGSDCWLQPLEWLEPDESYSLSFTGLGVLRVVQTRTLDERRARRVFPPHGSEQRQAAVFCGLEEAAFRSSPTLEPGSISVQVAPAALAGAGCFSLQVPEALRSAAVAPPQVGGVLLDPSPWLPSSTNIASEPVPTCGAGEPFHGACLEIDDDRLRVTPLAQDLFFSLAEPQKLALPARAGSRSLLVRGLLPGSEVTLAGTVLSSEGQLEAFHALLTTKAPRRHLVLNEVLANPLGLEPDAEWLELANDSEAPVSLAGLWLEDSGGHVALPAAWLAPGELALLVSERFRASGLDVPVPAAVRLLRVPSLGARGLSNGGEGLLLVGREGVLSRFPLLAAPHAGRSWARRTLDSADADAAAFGEHAGAGASPGAPNVLED